MTTQLLIYERATPITVARHRDWSVKSGEDYSFAARVNAVPLLAVEFPTAAFEFPVVFAGSDDKIMPSAILGCRNDENLFVGRDGAWLGTYRPAFLRQYPFVFASDAKGETLTLCIDEEFSGCNPDGRGERLFDTAGDRTAYLEAMLAFAQQYQEQFRRTEALCALLRELDLLEPMQATFRGPDGRQAQLTGFLAVSRAKLKALSGEQLKALAQNDTLELLFVHLQSLRHFQTLVKRLEGATPLGNARAQGDAETEIESFEPPAS